MSALKPGLFSNWNVRPTSTDAPTAAEQQVIQPNIPLHEGCMVLTKAPSLTMAKGQDAIGEWTLYDATGRAIDISGLGEEGQVLVRIRNALKDPADTYEVTATITDAANGVVRFTPPADVRDEAGVYIVEFGVIDDTGALLFTNSGLLSVERGLYGNDLTVGQGPITLEEVRLQLRDLQAENDWLADVEFDDVEILHSIIQPIRQWNEQPPHVALYSPCTFPHHYHWLRATCGNLLRIAATWYERNKANLAGELAKDRDKAGAYMQLANMYQQEWITWMTAQKIYINAASMYGSV